MPKEKKLISKIALGRIERLLELAKMRVLRSDRDSKRLAKRYAKLAKEISTHYKEGMPKSIENRICGKCGIVLVPGINCTVRKLSGRGMLYRCECGNESHVFIRR